MVMDANDEDTVSCSLLVKNNTQDETQDLSMTINQIVGCHIYLALVDGIECLSNLLSLTVQY